MIVFGGLARGPTIYILRETQRLLALGHPRQRRNKIQNLQVKADIRWRNQKGSRMVPWDYNCKPDEQLREVVDLQQYTPVTARGLPINKKKYGSPSWTSHEERKVRTTWYLWAGAHNDACSKPRKFNPENWNIQGYDSCPRSQKNRRKTCSKDLVPFWRSCLPVVPRRQQDQGPYNRWRGHWRNSFANWLSKVWTGKGRNRHDRLHSFRGIPW